MHFSKYLIKPFSNLVFKGRYLFYASIIEKSSYFFAFVLIARKFSQQNYGEVTAAFAFANILFSFFEFGFAFYFQREFASPQSDTLSNFARAFNFRLFLLPIFLAITSVYLYIESFNFFIGYIIAITVFILGYNNLFSGVFFGLSKFRKNFIALFWGRSTLLLSVIIFLLFESIVAVSLSFLFSALVQYFLSHQFLIEDEIRVPQKILPSWEKLTVVLHSSIPMAAGMIVLWLNDRLDILLLKNFAGSEAVAVYAVAYSVYKLPQAFSNLIFTPLFTDATKFYRENGKLQFHFILQRLSIVLLYIFAASFLILITSGEFILFVFGEKYASSVYFSQILTSALPWLLLNNFTGTLLNSVGLEKKAALSVLPSLIINILINILYIPVFGVIASVIATIIAEFIIFFIQLFLLLKSKRISFSR